MKNLIKTFRLLKKDQPDPARVETLFAKKDDQVLLGAMANPEHSEAAVNILRAIAQKRGLQNSVDQDWAQTEASMYVAPFGKQPTFEEVLAAPGRRRRIYRSLQGIMLACLLAAIAAFAYPRPYQEWIQEGIDAGQVDPATLARFADLPDPPDDKLVYFYLHGLNLFARDLRQNFGDIVIEGDSSGPDEEELIAIKASVYEQTVNAYVLIYEAGLNAGAMHASPDQPYLEALLSLLPSEIDFIAESGGDGADAFDHFARNEVFEPDGPRTNELEVAGVLLLVGGFLVWLLGGVFSWTRPYRMLLLRPFQSKRVSKPLKRFMKKNVAFYGHTITLSDKYLKESRFEHIIFWIPRSIPEIFVIILFIFPPVRQFKRWIKVGSDSSYHFLKKRMARRFTLNMFWQNAYNGNKLLKVKCSDTWWKQAVDLLMYSSQLIIVDLSWVKVGTEWELDKINRRDLEQKTVFIVGQEAADYAREVMAKFWPHEEAPPPLYVYEDSGKLLDSESYHRDVARIISESHLWGGIQANNG